MHDAEAHAHAGRELPGAVVGSTVRTALPAVRSMPSRVIPATGAEVMVIAPIASLSSVALTVAVVPAPGGAISVDGQVTTGGLSTGVQGSSGDAVFRGVGAAAVKSAALLSVSVQPPPARNAAVVALRVGAAPDPSKKFALP